MGKLLYLTGPSLGGKTRLALILTSYLSREDISVSNISFEILYKIVTSDYENAFYKLIDQQFKKEKDLIIAESVLFNSMLGQSALELLCWPKYEEHCKYYDSYSSMFGTADAKRRIFYDSIKKSRDKFISTYTYSKTTERLIYRDDSCLEGICKRVAEYVKN